MNICDKIAFSDARNYCVHIVCFQNVRQEHIFVRLLVLRLICVL